MLNIDKISFKNTNFVIYNTGYITIKIIDHVNIHCENPLCLIFDNVDGYMEKSNGEKYFIVDSIGKNKEVLKKYTKVWNEVKNQIETKLVVNQLNIRRILWTLGLNQMIVYLWVKY